jgi:hypothetical protein
MRSRPLRVLALALPWAIAACVSLPALEDRLTEADRAAPPPALVPLAPILAAADRPTVGLAMLDSRLARLAARADLLRRPVLTPRDRERLGL